MPFFIPAMTFVTSRIESWSLLCFDTICWATEMASSRLKSPVLTIPIL